MSSRVSFAATAGLLLLARLANAGPLYVRDDADDGKNMPLKEHIQASLVKYLDGQNVQWENFVYLEGGITVDWIDGNGITDQGKANAGMLKVGDQINKKDEPPNFFSDQYITFLKNATALSPSDNSTDAQLNQTAQAADQACMQDMMTITTKAVKDYQDFGGVLKSRPMNDTDFISWAQQNDDEYNVALTKCQDARNKVFDDYNTLKGDNYALFSRAIENIRPFTFPQQQVVPGITMNLTSDDQSTKQLANNVGGGDFYPLYQMDALAGTVSSWISGGIDGLVAFSYDSSQDHTTETIKEKTGSADAGLDFRYVAVEASAEHSESEKIYNSTATAFSVTYAGLALIDIEQGAWFDDYRAASAIHNGADDKTDKMKPALDKYFGKDNSTAGPAAVYNKQALVGYKPSITMSFESQDTYDSVKDTKASAKACFLIFCVGGSGGEHTEDHTTDDSKKSITFTDPTTSAHVLGLVQGKFWDSSTM